MVMSFKKAELLEALEAQRKPLAKIDKVAIAKHKKDEAAYFKEWKAALKRAASWDYAEAKKYGFNLRSAKGDSWWGRGPTCPQSLVATLDARIAQVTASKQTRYRVQDAGWTKGLYTILTVTMPKPTAVC